MSRVRDIYGEHLRKVVKHLLKQPVCEHRYKCGCKKCRKARR